MSGGGQIRVDVGALRAAVPTLQHAADSGRQALGTAAGTRCITTGCPELDAALGAYGARLQSLVTSAADAVDGLARGVASSAAAYECVDASLVPPLPAEGGAR
ncbi:MAG TPA: hypothetical protein VFS29_04630 [Motilibacteraceae bacterium]|nr:hypothetical protein [Motilibacteraceae bacterium]